MFSSDINILVCSTAPLVEIAVE